MRYYYFAFVIWVCKILLWVSIIGIPIERFLYWHSSDYWYMPFTEAFKKYKESKNNKFRG